MASYLAWAINIAVIVAGAVIYFTVLRPRVLQTSFVLGLAPTFGRWKTVALAYAVAAIQLLAALDESTLQSWGSVPWEKFFDKEIADKISLALVLLIPLTHTWSVLSAAKAQPVHSEE